MAKLFHAMNWECCAHSESFDNSGVLWWMCLGSSDVFMLCKSLYRPISSVDVVMYSTWLFNGLLSAWMSTYFLQTNARFGSVGWNISLKEDALDLVGVPVFLCACRLQPCKASDTQQIGLKVFKSRLFYHEAQVSTSSFFIIPSSSNQLLIYWRNFA